MGIPAPSTNTSMDLLDRLRGDTALAATFPAALAATKPEDQLLTALFEEAEERGLGGKRLLYFVALSLSLYETEGVATPWTSIITEFLKAEGLDGLYTKFRSDYISRKTLVYEEEGFRFSMVRTELLETFRLSLPASGRARWGAALQSQRDADVDALFGLLFAQGQRGIIAKCLAGEALTKTERETFSRTIKKRLLAILDPEVQQVARVLTGPGFRKKSPAVSTESSEGPRLVRRDDS